VYQISFTRKPVFFGHSIFFFDFMNFSFRYSTRQLGLCITYPTIYTNGLFFIFLSRVVIQRNPRHESVDQIPTTYIDPVRYLTLSVVTCYHINNLLYHTEEERGWNPTNPPPISLMGAAPEAIGMDRDPEWVEVYRGFRTCDILY